jgi:hypothetical protein
MPAGGIPRLSVVDATVAMAIDNMLVMVEGAVWLVVYLAGAEADLMEMTAPEAVAIRRAVEKLAALGDQLGYPHSSAVRGAVSLRELRPRGGRSPWRALYRRVGDVIVVAAIAPEAHRDHHGFDRAVRRACQQLEEIED